MEINATLKSVGSKMLFIFNKIPLVMRLCILFFFISIGFVMAESSYAQVTEISLSAHNQPIGAVLDAVESQSDFSFIYDSKLVNTTRKVTVDVKNKNIFDILNQLFSGSDVVYTVINNNTGSNCDCELIQLQIEQIRQSIDAIRLKVELKPMEWIVKK